MINPCPVLKQPHTKYTKWACSHKCSVSSRFKLETSPVAGHRAASAEQKPCWMALRKQMLKEQKTVFSQVIPPGLQVQMCHPQVTNLLLWPLPPVLLSVRRLKTKDETKLRGCKVDDHMSWKHVVDFSLYTKWFSDLNLWQLSRRPCRSKPTVSLKAFCRGVLLLLLTFLTVVARPTSWERCKQKDAVSNSFSGRSGKIKATGLTEHHTKPELLLKRQSGEQPCTMENTMCHFVANCTHSGARQGPYQHPLRHPHHTLPFLSALCFCVSSCCAITHTGLLFDFTSVLRWLRQARPGISAMWLKNGNRRQEYKRRHTGCGSGSLAGEWVVD